jgi:plasmid stabilization system protein ParE
MALGIYWSKKAGVSFEEITNYLEANFGEKMAKNFVRDIYFMLDILSIFPELGRVEYQKSTIRGLVVAKQVTLFYQIRTDRIILLNFYDNRQNPLKNHY